MRAARFFLFSFFGILFMFFPLTGHAQTSASFSSVNADVPQNTHTWTQTLLIETTSSLSCLMTGMNPIDPKEKCLGIDVKTRKIGYVENSGGAAGQMAQLIGMLYTPPLHTSDYFRHMANNFGLVKPAYAQSAGLGFQGLTPLLPLWTAFRNIAYLLLVVVFLFIGLAIMLRVKVDPRTVMSLENQLPKIIIGILAITFSFAIAGFMIDIMYVAIYLVAGVLNTVPGAETGITLANIQGQNTFEFASSSLNGIAPLANDPASAVGVVVQSLFDGPIAKGIFAVLGGALGWFAGTQLAQVFAPLGAGTVGAAIASTTLAVFAGLGASIFSAQILYGVVNILVFVIIGAAILIALFRLWFTLLFSYLAFILDVVFAPFWIIGAIVPESPINFESWIRDMLANLSVFPTTITMFLLGKIFMQAFENTGKGQLFVPPLIGNPGDPDALASIIGMTIILMTPGVATMMRDIFKAPSFKYTAVAGQQLGNAMEPIQRTARGALHRYTGVHYDKTGAHQNDSVPAQALRILFG